MLVYQPQSERQDVYTDSTAIVFAGCLDGGAAPCEWIKHEVIGVAGRFDDTFIEGERFLCRIAETFIRKIYQWIYISPPIIYRCPFGSICLGK